MNNFKNLIGKILHLNVHLKLVLALSLLALFFKLFLLYNRALYLDPDEGYYLLLARNLVSGNGYTFNGLPNIIFPPFLPLCIGFFYLIFHNFQFSLNFITALSGSFLGIIIFLIVRKKLSPSYSVFCSFLVLFLYQLNAFFPVKARYIEVLYRGSDIINCFLLFLAVYFILRMIETDAYSYAILSAFTIAFAYLTRPEGFLFFWTVFTILLLLKVFSLIAVSFKRLFLLFIVFILLSSPYIFYLKSITGIWGLSGKISASLQYRESLLKVIKNDDWNSFSKQHYSLNKDLMEMNDIYFGYYQNADTGNKISFSFLLRQGISNLKMYYIIPKILFPPYILIFFVLGIASTIYSLIKKKEYFDFVLFGIIPYSLLIEALSYPIPRHHLFLVPFLCIYAAKGMEFISLKLSKDKLLQKRIRLLLFTAIVFFIINSFLVRWNKNLFHIPNFKHIKVVEKEIGNYLKNKKAKIIMSGHPSFAVWSFSDWQVLPMTNLASTIKFAHRKHVDFIIFPKRGIMHYDIVDMSKSYIPSDQNGNFEFEILEKNQQFSLIVVKKSQL